MKRRELLKTAALGALGLPVGRDLAARQNQSTKVTASDRIRVG